MNKLSPMKSVKNVKHMKRANNLSVVKTVVELSIINSNRPRSLYHLCS